MTRIKICGLTQLADAERAAELGAWALGFIFFRPSPRFVDPSVVRGIVDRLPASTLTVGVFVNESPEKIREFVGLSGVRWVQLHGNESPEFCHALQTPFVKALRLGKDADVNQAAEFRGAQALLTDTPHESLWGGTGELSDWRLARELKRHGDVLLSGGLKPSNVGEAVRRVRPFGVDVSSGVESAPGRKDHKELAALFSAVAKEDREHVNE